jgi:solute carrier family 38 (sodium-coupled neutral amino acid transporter), member 9
VIIFPLINLKSSDFFTKFNALGVMSVIYILMFVFIKSGERGINFSYASCHLNCAPATLTAFVFVSRDEAEARGSFTQLTGTLALAFFIHNGILSIVRNAKEPKKVVRSCHAHAALPRTPALTYPCVHRAGMLALPIFWWL